MIHKALYGLRSSEARQHDKLSDVLKKNFFVPCKAKPDIWMHQNENQYEYVAVYVDVLAFAVKDPQSFFKSSEESTSSRSKKLDL